MDMFKGFLLMFYYVQVSQELMTKAVNQ